MGEALVEACPDGGNIFAINGSPTDKNVEEVELGFRKALKGSKLKIVYTGYCDNWLAEMAATHVNKGLEVTDDIVGVMCGNDGLAGQVALVAQDADLAACQRIVEGTQTMTVYKPIEQEASTAAILAVALGNGTDITSKDCEIPATETTDDGSGEIPYYKITPIAVTAENMDEVIVDGGFHSKEDVYLNVKE